MRSRACACGWLAGRVSSVSTRVAHRTVSGSRRTFGTENIDVSAPGIEVVLRQVGQRSSSCVAPLARKASNAASIIARQHCPCSAWLHPAQTDSRSCPCASEPVCFRVSGSEHHSRHRAQTQLNSPRWRDVPIGRGIG